MPQHNMQSPGCVLTCIHCSKKSIGFAHMRHILSSGEDHGDDEEDMHIKGTGWAHATFGKTVPLPPGIYGVAVMPGKAWEHSGWIGQNVFDDNYCIGRVTKPSTETLLAWARYPTEAIENGMDPRGGWSPTRSARVVWKNGHTPLNYKADDDGEFDLDWWPQHCAPHLLMKNGMKEMQKSMQRFTNIVRKLSRTDQRAGEATFDAAVEDFLKRERKDWKRTKNISWTRLQAYLVTVRNSAYKQTVTACCYTKVTRATKNNSVAASNEDNDNGRGSKRKLDDGQEDQISPTDLD